ncbi:MAG: hypothetical protein AAFX09_06305 [Pseudomonadota bacterium]
MIAITNSLILIASAILVLGACTAVVFRLRDHLVRGLAAAITLLILLEIADLFVLDHLTAAFSIGLRGALEEVLRAALFASVLAGFRPFHIALLAAVLISVIESAPWLGPILYAALFAIAAAPETVQITTTGPSALVLTGGWFEATMPAFAVGLRVALHAFLGFASILAFRHQNWGALFVCACLHAGHNLTVTLVASEEHSPLMSVATALPSAAVVIAGCAFLARRLKGAGTTNA